MTYTAVLPPAVVEWAGITSRSRSHGPVIDDDNVDITLPALNDSGHPFAEIADLIERNA
jgi:hypothetical protein